MKRNLLLFVPIGVLCTALGIYAGSSRLQPDAPQTSAVANLFEQSMQNARGGTEPLSSWKDKRLLVNFWATWCAPCVEEMPELAALQTEVAGKNAQIIGIGIDSLSNIAEFATKHKIDYPLYVAGVTGTELTRRFGNGTGGLPFTVLISAGGKVEKTYLGRLNISEVRKDLGL